jgi:hypothetical protein
MHLEFSKFLVMETVNLDVGIREFVPLKFMSRILLLEMLSAPLRGRGMML